MGSASAIIQAPAGFSDLSEENKEAYRVRFAELVASGKSEMEAVEELSHLTATNHESEFSEARNQLSDIRPSDLKEISGLSKPPALVLSVCEALAVVMQQKTTWSDIKKFMNDKKFIQKVHFFVLYIL